MPPAGATDTTKEAVTAEIKPDPDYEFRRKALDLVQEWQNHDSESTEDNLYREETILPKVKELVRHNLTNNAEIEACDLLMEIERIDILKEMAQQLEHLDYERICLYILSCAPFTPDPDNITLINMSKDLYMHFGRTVEALRCAMRTNDTTSIETIFGSTNDSAVKMQMALMLGRQQIFLDIEDQLLSQLNANFYLNKHFLAFARELDLMTPKTPEEVYKTYLEPNRPFATQQVKNMTLQNLASSFVNGFVNSGFGTDAFFKDEKSSNDWLAKHKEWAAFSTIATFGLIHHWNVDSLNNFEIHTQSKDIYVKGGALFATGIVFSGVQDPEVDPAFAILQDFLFSEHLPLRVASTFGLGLAYANSKRQTVIDPEESVVASLRKVINDDQLLSDQAEVKGLAALSLGFILIGTGRANNEIVCELLTYLMSGVDLKDVNMRLVALGIGLIFLGKQNECDETILEPLRALSDPFGKIASTLVDVCAYAGTGNVLKVQEMLHICSEHYEKEEQKDESKTKVSPGAPLPDITAPTSSVNGNADEEDANATKTQSKSEEAAGECLSQAVAVIGIALVAMGEDIGSQMCLRQFGHLYRYGEPIIRRAVPLALALLSPSNPQLTVIETLSKYSHDSDAETARNAIFALGLVGAGTNNARVLAMLRQLATYHSRDQKTMILLRIAQGLIHLGKGTMTLNPFHSDRQLICPTVVGALLCVCLAFIDSEQTVLNGKQHYLLFSLVAAIQPRMLITVVQDEKDNNELVQKSVQVRVGQAVDVVAQAGKPRAITGFQTHSTPVLLGYGERAELADDDCKRFVVFLIFTKFKDVPLTPILEGICFMAPDIVYLIGKLSNLLNNLYFGSESIKFIQNTDGLSQNLL
ncbi:26S proteasome non-ATPase regulatory subunit 2 [Meloidogyne graminicola]|uniref:26S proteasome non-ATPase regulatory subunit 2 n=1 Tax=Meloidogyne graminicola TaxID=189291 RepID=A0A8S9ZUB9_9BILA|nr:26S proteasome non-ATPase regulatory subunit 2 [Meloidogyne graminicola]